MDFEVSKDQGVIVVGDSVMVAPVTEMAASAADENLVVTLKHLREAGYGIY